MCVAECVAQLLVALRDGNSKQNSGLPSKVAEVPRVAGCVAVCVAGCVAVCVAVCFAVYVEGCVAPLRDGDSK